MTRAATRLLVLAVLAVLALPGAAMANPVRDCNTDGDLDKQYSNAELRRAIDNLPTDLDEYSNCREILSGAISSGSDQGGNRPTAGADGSPLSPAEQAARARDSSLLEEITSDPEKHPPSVVIAGQRVEPGSNGLFDLATASNDLPAPLLMALVALALAALPLLSKLPTPSVSFPRFWR